MHDDTPDGYATTMAEAVHEMQAIIDKYGPAWLASLHAAVFICVGRSVPSVRYGDFSLSLTVNYPDMQVNVRIGDRIPLADELPANYAFRFSGSLSNQSWCKARDKITLFLVNTLIVGRDC